MKVRADLHIHTVLSPCGDLDMSPVNIIDRAGRQGLQVIGITDHNSTRQAPLVRDYGREKGVLVLTGAEVTTQEEVHCLTFFPDDEKLHKFQHYLDEHLPPIPNVPEKFGDQVVVDSREQILYEEKKLLISALDQTIEEIEQKVHAYGGIFIPAHIDKPCFSILSQLGFLPSGLRCDALELSSHTSCPAFFGSHPELKKFAFIRSSDAHYPEDIGKVYTELDITELSFNGIADSLRKRKS